MKPIDLLRRRLRSQRLDAKPLARPSEVVAWLAAVQAQDFAGAKWALALRMRKATDDDIEQAFAAGSILRTHLLRPTWHFVTPDDIRWLLELTAPRVHVANASMYRTLGLDKSTFRRSQSAMAKALRGGIHLTRGELGGVLQGSGVPITSGLQLAYIMMAAELDGVICSGPRRGKQFTYALLEERAPRARPLERDRALAELSRRFFVSRGPATTKDFARWCGLTLADAERGLEAVRSGLEHEQVDGRDYWFSATGASAARNPSVHFLSVYDEYLSGYQDHSLIASAQVLPKVRALGGALGYVIVVDGRIVGFWRRRFVKTSVVIEVGRFTRWTSQQEEAIVRAAARYGKYVGTPYVVRRAR